MFITSDMYLSMAHFNFTFAAYLISVFFFEHVDAVLI